jgi:hypothetical protein
VKAIKSPFKLLYVLMALKKDQYDAFKQIAGNKHFYDWQWKILDKFYS